MSLAKRAFPAMTVLFLLGLSVFLLAPRHFLVPSVQGTSRTISLVGYASGGWNMSNPTITVTQGDSVTIKASSGDGIIHQFWLDADNDTLSDQSDCPAVDPCSTTSTSPPPITFTANFNPGTYGYHCTVHPATMNGKFIVQAPSTPDFSITSSPPSLTILQGSSGTTTVTLASVGSFSGTVSLTKTVSPSGPSVSFSPASVPLSAGASGTSTMTVSAAGGLYSSVAIGDYSVNVTATSGSLSHSTIVVVIVSSATSTPSSAGSGPGGLPIVALIGAAIALLVVIGVVVYLVRRKPVAN